VKCRVKNRHVSGPGKHIHGLPDALQVGRVVNRGQRDGIFHSRDDVFVHKHRTGEPVSTVYGTMSHQADLRGVAQGAVRTVGEYMHDGLKALSMIGPIQNRA